MALVAQILRLEYQTATERDGVISYTNCCYDGARYERVVASVMTDAIALSLYASGESEPVQRLFRWY